MADSTSDNKKHASKETSQGEIEEEAIASSRPTSTSLKHGEINVTAIPEDEVTNQWQRLANKLTRRVGAEARGIERVDESLRTTKTPLKSYYEMTAIWFSVNLTANILTIGVLGPVTFGLGALDSMMCCLFGTILGTLCTCYMATYGAMSGCRSLVVSRFTMGWWPNKLCVLLAMVVIMGYGMVDAVTTGLLFAAASEGKVSVVLGIIIFGLIVWFVTAFGVNYLKYFEKYAYVPQVCALHMNEADESKLFVLVGCAAPHMNPQMKSELTGKVLIGARVSYLFVCTSGPLGWAPFIADSFVYNAPSTKRWGVFFSTALGFVASKVFVEFIGIGLGTGLAINESWMTGFTKYGVGGLIVNAYGPLGSFGKFCAVIIGLGITANMIPGNYSTAFCTQILSKKLEKVPRIVWNTMAVIIYIVIAIPGREKLLTIFSNFLPLIGYWVTIWIVLTVEEEWLFRRRLNSENPYDWSAWDNASRLPLGIAAFTSFVIGWVGAILCMSQVYYTGPIATLADADLGLPVCAAWGGLVYPLLRHLELKRFGR